MTLRYSHRHFHESARAEAERAAVQGRPFAVIVGLLDFPEINRERGFGAGDAALQSVAEVFQRVAARQVGSAFRSSGRAIAMLVPGLEEQETEAVVDSLSRELGSQLSVGLGTAAWRHGESGEHVIERATQAARGSTAVAA